MVLKVEFNQSTCRGKVKKDRIAYLEKKIGIKFPKSFIETVKNCDGGTPANIEFLYYCQSSKSKSGSGIGCFLALNPSQSEDFLDYYLDPSEGFPKGLIAFGDTGCGDFICFDYREGKDNPNPPIVVWDHGDPDDLNPFFVAKDFESFLEILVDEIPEGLMPVFEDRLDILSNKIKSLFSWKKEEKIEPKVIRVYSRVKAPQSRKNLLCSLNNLADAKAQKDWPCEDHPHAFWDSLKLFYDVIYNDLKLDDNPEDKLGYILVDQEECDVLRPLTRALTLFYNEVGPQQPDSAYLDSPFRPKVIRCAQKALDVFMANENKIKAQNPRHWDDEDDWDKVPV